jgi:hypothetical protein
MEILRVSPALISERSDRREKRLWKSVNIGTGLRTLSCDAAVLLGGSLSWECIRLVSVALDWGFPGLLLHVLWLGCGFSSLPVFQGSRVRVFHGYFPETCFPE